MSFYQVYPAKDASRGFSVRAQLYSKCHVLLSLLMLPNPDLPGIRFLHTNDLVAVENTKRVKSLLQLE